MKLSFSLCRLSTISVAGLLLAGHVFYADALPAPPSQTSTPPPPLGYVNLPAPRGPHAVGTTNIILTDHGRLEILSPTPNTTARTFVAQIFYPTLPLKKLKKYALSPYLTPGLRNWTETSFGLPANSLSGVITNSYVDSPVVLPNGGAKEVVLFSSGYGGSRSFYTNFHENLASLGYVVIAMEHLYDVTYVDIPGLGEFYNTFGNRTGGNLETEVGPMHKVRVEDSLFILSSLANKTSQLVKGVEALLENCEGNYPSKGRQSWWSKDAKVAMYGHSLGGSTTAMTMITNKTPTKISGGINLDGTFWGPTGRIQNPPPSSYVIKAPFLMWGAPGHSSDEDVSWKAVYSHVLKGWKRELSLEGAAHNTFTDFPALADLFGIRSSLPPDLINGLFGTIPGVRSLDVIRQVVENFVAYTLRGDNEAKKLLDGAGKKQWPEVIFKF